jgi:hypothetical protein
MATEIPEIIWFSRFIPIRKKNEGLTIAHKKANAEKDCEKLLAAHPLGKPWKISGFKWKGPTEDEPRHKLTVFIVEKRKKKKPGPPTDPPIPAQTSPPPSM